MSTQGGLVASGKLILRRRPMQVKLRRHQLNQLTARSRRIKFGRGQVNDFVDVTSHAVGQARRASAVRNKGNRIDVGAAEHSQAGALQIAAGLVHRAQPQPAQTRGIIGRIQNEGDGHGGMNEPRQRIGSFAQRPRSGELHVGAIPSQVVGGVIVQYRPSGKRRRGGRGRRGDRGSRLRHSFIFRISHPPSISASTVAQHRRPA